MFSMIPTKLIPTKFGKIVNRHGLDPVTANQIVLAMSNGDLAVNVEGWKGFIDEARLYIIANDEFESPDLTYEVSSAEHSLLENYRKDIDVDLPTLEQLAEVLQKNAITALFEAIPTLPFHITEKFLFLDRKTELREFFIKFGKHLDI